MALEKSETVHTNVEVVSPLLTKTTVVRRTVRSEYVRGGFLHYVFVTFFSGTPRVTRIFARGETKSRNQAANFGRSSRADRGRAGGPTRKLAKA